MLDFASLAPASTKAALKSSIKSILSSFSKADGSSLTTSAVEQKPKSKQPEWMDASLPEKVRWKKWEKERDRQIYGKGGTAGYFNSFYRGSGAWWIGSLGSAGV